MDILPDVIESLYPPTVFDSAINSNRYAVFGGRNSGQEWFIVPKTFTIADATKHWKKLVPGKRAAVNNQSWQIANSKGNGFYTVNVADGIYSCSCVGFTYHRTCRHIKQVQK